MNNGEHTITSSLWYSSKNHSEELLPAIKRVMDIAQCNHKDVTGIAVALGPGRFSSLRAGISIVKGLTIHRDIPVVGIGTLELEAYPYLDTDLPVCAIMESGKIDFAAAIFRGRPPQTTKIMNESIVTREQLANIIEERGILCGEGTQNLPEETRRTLLRTFISINFSGPTSRLAALSSIGYERLLCGSFYPIDNLQPLYVRRPTIGTPTPPKKVNL